jgi:hypothetical protein
MPTLAVREPRIHTLTVAVVCALLHLQARQQEARSQFDYVWAIDDVPRFGQQRDSADMMSGLIEGMRFIGIDRDPAELFTSMADRSARNRRTCGVST